MNAPQDSARREVVVANLFLATLMLVGAGGYVLIEGWDWIDAFYMTFLTLTTIGFGEVHELSAPGRAFTIVLGLAGIGSVAFIATRSAQLLLNSRSFRNRQLMRMIENTKGHYMLAGYGRIGSRIAQDLLHSKVPFVVIENQPQKLERILEAGHLYVDGDAEEEETLLRAGIDRAKGLILTLPDDRANVFVTLVARELNPNLFILARTDKSQNKRKLLHAGANTVVSPYEIGADRMAQVILQPTVDKFMQRVRHTESMNLEEVPIEEGSPLAGRTLAGSEFRKRFDAIVVAIIDAETGEMAFNPKGDFPLTPGDSLVVLGSSEMVERLRREGCNAPTPV